MRITPRELRGVRRDGMLIRFAMLGPVAYVEVELPPEGSAGTGFETPSRNPGWGLVLRGHVTLHHGEVREFPAGTAFYIPPGTPDHRLTATGGTIVAGFAPVGPDADTSDESLTAQGFEHVTVAAAALPLPGTIRSLEPSTVFRRTGAIEVETARMGEWLYMRGTFGPLSGYTGGWCDLPHWGIVLRGDFALHSEHGVELLAAGDVYYCPAGPPGHQFQVADAATTIDYTPIGEFDEPRRKSDWRWAAWSRAKDDTATVVPQARVVASSGAERGTDREPDRRSPPALPLPASAGHEPVPSAGDRLRPNPLHQRGARTRPVA